MEKESIDLIIVRHGKAAHNLGNEKEHTFAGSQIDNELTESGIENAEFLAEQIKNSSDVDAIVTSPLKRAVQTAEIIKDKLDQEISIHTLNELSEVNIGDFAGHTEDEVKQLFPAEATAFYNGDIENWQFPNGENFDQVSKRLDVALKKIEKLTHDKRRIIISGHGMINRILFYKLNPENPELWQKRSYPHDRIEVMKIEREN